MNNILNHNFGKVTTLKKSDNGTAIATAMLLYTKDIPVVDNMGNRVILNKKFLENISSRFNKTHKGILGFGKRYPKLIMEHQYEVEEVVGRIDSSLEIEQVVLEGKSCYALFCKVLLSEPEIIDKVESGALNGVSSGIYFDEEGAYLKELTLTEDPALEHAVLLSNKDESMLFCKSSIVEKLLAIESKLDSIEIKKEERILLSEAKSKSIKKENEIEKILLSQIVKNKIVRKDLEFLKEKCKNLEGNTLEAIFSKVAPLKKNRGTNLSMHPVSPN